MHCIHMHFWIDKRSQGCGFNVRRQVPPSLSGYGRNQRILCGSLYPEPMVTPVHRFQSIESATNNRLRYARSPGYHPRIHSQVPPTVHYNGSSSNIRMPHMGRSLEMIAPGHTPTARNNNSPKSKLKCGVWIFFAVVTFFLAGAKYYFHGINIGVEALVFCSLLVIVLIIGGLISLCEAITSYSPTHTPIDAPNMATPEQQEIEETHNQVPTPAMPQNSSEMPPPPYHIAVMLSPTADLDAIQVIRDSPPPSYEKAVT
ncbi:uncharacterized protein LOC108903494 isoform X2 [Anoplophora glabripennis]|uniref:uncharacterized protein LOC108903494 isoform X2 n=1 Tax=Anoplophora glabripennis TaxID=217634 RepID=UPI0008759581|nr:uncharacterized protein LOC108903494 isoform X2 [Anoplophora glabripennis]